MKKEVTKKAFITLLAGVTLLIIVCIAITLYYEAQTFSCFEYNTDFFISMYGYVKVSITSNADAIYCIIPYNLMIMMLSLSITFFTMEVYKK